eukprot:11440570-Ditylum_brightwellii.AAC.1
MKNPKVKESTTKQAGTRLQRDIDVSLQQRLSISLNITSLDRIKRVMTDITHHQQYGESHSIEDKVIEESTNQLRTALDFDGDGGKHWVDQTPGDNSSETSEDPYWQIMKQYAEARHLARTREIRGGILVPSIEYDESDDEMNGEGIVTFDTFFDANDQSFCSYKSMVVESTTTCDNEWNRTHEEDSSFVQTKMMFHLQEGSVKLCFCDDPLDESAISGQS